MIEVTIGESAQKVIHDELKRARRDIECGVETGGWLWAEQGSPWWGGVEIVEASGPGPDDVRGWGEMVFMHGYLFDLDELFRREGLELCGGWHCHPSGDTMPSSVDTMPSDTDTDRIGTVLKWRTEWGCRTARSLELIYAPEIQIGERGLGGRGFSVESWVFGQGTSVTGAPMLKPEPSVVVRGAWQSAHPRF